ncbi:MAG: hypothetical protein QUV08_10255 [Parasphingorhabdus sp.]|nr:hypothetical protein [Parasphingorhabdus sp.]
MLPENESWEKKNYGGFAKSKKLSAGAIVALLVSANDELPEIEKVYERFRELSKSRGTMFRLTGVAAALALLSYFDVVDKFSASGFSVESEYLGHISLALVSVSNLLYASNEPKIAFIKSWFDHKYSVGNPAEKSMLLLNFPGVYDFPNFSFHNIGYPKDVHPKRFPSFWPYVILVIIVSSLIAVGSTLLFVLVAIEVWVSPNLPIVSKSLVVISGLCSLTALTSPKFWGLKREYVHYGLSNILTRFEKTNPQRHQHFFKMITKAKIKMGLVDFDKND